MRDYVGVGSAFDLGYYCVGMVYIVEGAARVRWG